MLFYRFIFVIYLLACFYPAGLKFGIGPLSILDFCFIISLFYLGSKLRNTNNIQVKHFLRKHLYSERFLFWFFVVGIFYVGLSFTNYIELFTIDDTFLLLVNYIPRQSYFIFYILMGWSLFISVSINFQRFISDLQYIKIIIFGLLISVFLGLTSGRIITTILPFCILFLYRTNKKPLAIIFTVLYFISFTQAGSTNAISVVILILFLMFSEKKILNWFAKIWYLFMILFIATPFFLYNTYLEQLQKFDGNTAGRLRFWADNVETLKKTHYIGVGFGTPYFSNAHAFYVYEGKIDVNELGDTLYVTGQHNSIVNVFYRMGLVGGICFLCFNGILFVEIRKAMKIAKLNNQKHLFVLLDCLLMAFILGLLNITFNVGLESPRVFISYLIFCSLAIAVSHRVIYNYKYKDISAFKD